MSAEMLFSPSSVQAVSTSGLDLPPEFTDCLGTRPAVIQGAHLQLEE